MLYSGQQPYNKINFRRLHAPFLLIEAKNYYKHDIELANVGLNYILIFLFSFWLHFQKTHSSLKNYACIQKGINSQ